MMVEHGQYVPGSIWFYAPNKVAPAIWAFLFSISLLIHAFQCIRYKCWKVTGVLPWAALLFVVGYILREIGAFNYTNLKIYISSIVFVYSAPPLYELSNYLILSRILYYVPYHSPIHPGRVLTTFGALSSAIESLNANGAASTANSSSSPQHQANGRAILKTALILQLIILTLFVLLAATFHRRCLAANLLPPHLKTTLTTLYTSSALIGIRTIYRTIEYFTISSLHITPQTDIQTLSPLLRYEWFFWVFEATLMLCNSFLLNWKHPMRFLPRDNTIYLGVDGVTEIKGEGYEDKRRWVVTVLDPFDVVGLFKGRQVRERF